MAFVKVQKSRSGGRGETEPVIRMASHLHGGAKSGPPRGVYISISQPVIREVGWDVEEIQSRRENTKGNRDTRNVCMISIQEGVGEDAGFIMLVEDKEKGYTAGTNKGEATSYTLSLSIQSFLHYVLNDVPHEPVKVEFTVDPNDKTILIQCPDFLRYNPLSYQEPEPVKPEVKKETTRRPPTLSVVVRDKESGDEILPNRHQRRQITKRLAQALRN